MKSTPVNNIKLLVNKTIVKAVRPDDGELLFFQFDDNTHMFIEVESEYNVALFNFDPHINDKNMCKVGLMSDEEYRAIQDNNDKARRRSNEQCDRATYERLKVKYEGE